MRSRLKLLEDLSEPSLRTYQPGQKTNICVLDLWNATLLRENEYIPLCFTTIYVFRYVGESMLFILLALKRIRLHRVHL